MSFHDLHFIVYFVGALVHGSQVILIGRRWREAHASERIEAREGLIIIFCAFGWQFGNFLYELANTAWGTRDYTLLHNFGDFLRAASLTFFPLVFSHMLTYPEHLDALKWRRLFRKTVGLSRYLLWPWTALVLVSLAGQQLGVAFPAVKALWGMAEVINYGGANTVTLWLMLAFFLIFSVFAISQHREEALKSGPARRASRSFVAASGVAAVFFVLMLFGNVFGLRGFQDYIGLAAQMTSVPFSLYIAYRYYRFPFMDAYLREVLAGLILISAFVSWMGLTGAAFPEGFRYFFGFTGGLAIAYWRPSLSRWVERTFMGYSESVDRQEERIETRLREIPELTQFREQAAGILGPETESDWIEVTDVPRADAIHNFEIHSTDRMFLALGPRSGGRSYMSRHLRLARSAALALAAHYEALKRGEHERRRLVEAAELREAATQAQMQALRAQINPHFLFNTLNVLANLIHSNPERAETVTEQLADIFRYALESTRRETVALGEEIQFLESYLEIERTRFEENLKYRFDVDSNVMPVRIPPMLLQPLVENAIKHGISARVGGGEVVIRAHQDAGNLTVVVEDSGLGPGNSPTNGAGVGLANVRERLHHAFGGAATLTVEPLTPHGTRVVVRMPVPETVSPEDLQ